MRTTGNFTDVYKQAKIYYNDPAGRPIDAVIRKENEKWIIESRLEPQQDTIIECSLEDFQNWFYETFSDDNYIPSENDIADFVKQFAIEIE